MVSRAQQRVGAVGLQVQVGRDLAGIVQQHLVHRHGIGAQVLGPLDDRHLRVLFAQPVHDHRAVGVDHHLADLRAAQQRIQDMLVERLAGQRAVILARHALRMMAHGHQRDNSRSVLACIASPIFKNETVSSKIPSTIVRSVGRILRVKGAHRQIFDPHIALPDPIFFDKSSNGSEVLYSW
jgi:hypothetical protein